MKNKNKIIIFLLMIAFVLSSCKNIVQEIDGFQIEDVKENQIIDDEGIVEIKMFVPDYYLLSKQDNDNRAIAPQTQKLRLSYKQSQNEANSWFVASIIDLKDAKKTPIEIPGETTHNIIPGYVYTFAFTGLELGEYAIGEFRVDLLDKDGKVITSGFNNTAVTISKDNKASTDFFTFPTTTTGTKGFLAAGNMEFIQIATIKDMEYSLTINTDSDYPDIVLFSSTGKFEKYFSVDDQTASQISFKASDTGVCYLGIWADDGYNITDYNIIFNTNGGTVLKDSVLSGTDLHWTKTNSPYYVNHDILVEENTELLIEPGVKVFVSGPYSIQVRGSIKAVGSKEEPILFLKSIDNMGNWNGLLINGSDKLKYDDGGNYISGNRISYCNFLCATTPLTIQGQVYVNNCIFKDNIDSVSVEGNYSLLISNVFNEGLKDSRSSDSKYISNEIYNNLNCSGDFFNNQIFNADISQVGFCQNNDFISCKFSSTGMFHYNNFNNCSFKEGTSSFYSYSKNNFIDCKSPIFATKTKYEKDKSHYVQSNYWGEANTKELQSLNGTLNVSFLEDYYDNFNYSKFDYSNWYSAPIKHAGYKADGFIDFEYNVDSKHLISYRGNEIYEKNIFINIIPKYHINELTKIKIAQSPTDLESVQPIPYSKQINYSVDKTKIVDGKLYLYMQLVDSLNNVSRVYEKIYAYNTAPSVSMEIEDNKVFTTEDKTYSFNISLKDNGALNYCIFYINGMEYNKTHLSNYVYTERTVEQSLPIEYMEKGNYELKAVVVDQIGNRSEEIKHITIDRNIDPTLYENKNYTPSTGEFIADSDTVYLWHLNGDGKEVKTNTTIEFFNGASGGLGGGYGQDLRVSEENNSMPLSLNNKFTIEFWSINEWDLDIDKNECFRLSLNSSGNEFSRDFEITTKDLSGKIRSHSLKLFPRDVNYKGLHYWSLVNHGNILLAYCDGILVGMSNTFKEPMNENSNYLRVSLKNCDELRISNNARSVDEISSYYEAARKVIKPGQAQ